MTFKTHTFTYTFSDYETAQVGSTAIIGYMIGKYHAPAVETTVQSSNRLVVEYAADKAQSKPLKRICDAFNGDRAKPEAETSLENRYRLERVEQLKQSETFDSLLDKVVAYELELLDYAERLLSDEPIPMDFMTAEGTLDLLGAEGVGLLKSLDEDGEYSGLADYKAGTE